MADLPLIGVKIAGWRHGCCYNVMVREGAPPTTSADAGRASRGWRPYGRHDEKAQPRPAPYFNAHETCACHNDLKWVLPTLKR